MVSLERPPGTTSRAVTTSSGDPGNLRRRYPVSCSAESEHRVDGVSASAQSPSPSPASSESTARRISSTRSRNRRSTSTSRRQRSRVAASSLTASSATTSAARRRSSTKRSGLTVSPLTSASSVSKAAPNSSLSVSAHSSSTMSSARIRSTNPAASLAEALVSSGRNVLDTVARTCRRYRARSSAGCLTVSPSHPTGLRHGAGRVTPLVRASASTKAGGLCPLRALRFVSRKPHPPGSPSMVTSPTDSQP